MQKHILFILSLAMMLLMWPVQACDLAGRGESRAGEAVCDFVPGPRPYCPASNLIHLTEMRDEGDQVTYESIPENVGFPNLQQQENEKQERAWDMLNNSLVVVPGNDRRPPHPVSQSGR